MTRLEDAQAAMIEAKIALGGHERHDRKGLSWCFSNRPAGVNFAWNPHLQERDVDSVVESVLASARKRKSSLDFLLFPSSTPSDLRLVLRRKWRLMGPMYLPGMVLNLGSSLAMPRHRVELRTDWTLPKPPVNPLQRWVPKVQKSDWWLLHQQLAETGRLHVWEAKHEGRPAACACLFIHEGHALITSVMTEPDFRGLGLGESVMLACLAHARDLGCDQAGLLTHKRAMSFYQRLGFVEEGVFSALYFSKTRAEAEHVPQR